MNASAQRCDEELEQEICYSIDVRLRHVPDDFTTEFDAILLERVDVHERLEPAPGIVSAVELKTCLLWIEDRHSRGDRRRGRWWVGRRAHERLVDLEGCYCLVVLNDDDTVLAYTLVRADVLDELLEHRWTTNGAGARNQGNESAQLPWPAVLDPDAVEEGRT